MRSQPFFLIAAVLLLAGCQPTASPPAQKAPIAEAPLPTDRPATADEVVASDPCSTRLHDIEGLLLMYYALNKRFPVTLDEVKPLADGGTVDLTCPVSHQPYGYSQAGLLSAGTDRRILVWDPTPVHHGIRWCIVLPQAAPGAALVPDVLPINEQEFLKFIPPIQ